MKAIAIALLLVAAWGFAAAIRDVFFAGVPRPEPFQRYLWFAIGSFLIPLIPLLLGLWLWKRANDEVEGDDARPNGEPLDAP